MIKFYMVDTFLTGVLYYIQGYAMSVMLEAKGDKRTVLFYSISQIVAYIIIFYIFKLVMPYKSIAFMSWGLATCLFIYRARMVRAILCFFMTLIPSIIVEVIASQLVFSVFGKVELYVGDIRYSFFAKSFAIILVMPLIILCVVIWQRIVRRSPSVILREYVLFVVSQAVLLSICFYLSYISERLSFALIITSIALVLCMIADYFLFRSLKKANERYMLVQKNRVIEGQLNTQLDYYNQLKENIDRNNKLSHDYLNQMQTIKMLLDKGEVQLAKNQLSILTLQTEGGRVDKYCANVIVNAVIESKAQICDVHGIKLNAEIRIPQEISIEGIHLCSVFANLLDNAIESCQRANSSDCFINMSAGIIAGSLVIKQENTNVRSSDASASTLKGKKAEPYHGFGLEIMKDIANHYKGDIEFSSTETMFISLVRLCL